MKKLEFNESSLQQNEMSKIQGGTSTTVIKGREADQSPVTENEWYGDVRPCPPDEVWIVNR